MLSMYLNMIVPTHFLEIFNIVEMVFVFSSNEEITKKEINQEELLCGVGEETQFCYTN